MNLRCFIAVEIPDPIKKGISELIDNLKRHDADVKWVPVENIHITLKFLGSTPDELLPKIRESFLNILPSYEPFYIKIYGVGVFPNTRNPRVIWVGTEDSEVLKKIRMDIEILMQKLGFEKDDKSFTPHLTIGRVRSRKGIINIINELTLLKDMEFGNINVGSIKIMKSDLKPKGAEYSSIYEVPLGRGEGV